MLTENQKKWVKALRSGEYEQAKGALQTPLGFCCLGAGVKICEKNGGSVPHEGEGGIFGFTLGRHPSVMKWLGLRQSCGEFNRVVGNNYRALADLNDSGQWTFDQIADFIESEPEGLFVDPQTEV